LDSELGAELLLLVVAISISMALIPLMIRLAPTLGMMDKPDPRKVHAMPIPRVGGVGIVLGALLPLAFWLPWNDLTLSYLMGSVVLLVFGIWDDIAELGHYVKFIGQFIAVLTVVFHGDLYISYLPFMGMEPIGETVGKVFTVIAMVGVINAINHSDGLDGLAGGESLLSLGGIAYLASQADDTVVTLIAVATMGGVFGFLRFNSHPARVFMGDGGSQFLGFTLAFLVAYLAKVTNPALSPALPALLLGLPVVDILSVLVRRLRGGMNLFKATKNHVHHRLLELGFYHYESVMVIYSVQVTLVLAGVLMPYESDALIIGFYLLVCSTVFVGLKLAEDRHLKVHRGKSGTLLGRLVEGFNVDGPVMALNYGLMQMLLSVFLFAGAVLVVDVPADLSLAASALFVALSLRLWLGHRVWFLYMRLILFVAVAFSAYLLEFYPPAGWDGFSPVYHWFLGVLAVAVVLAVRFSEDDFFRATPLDYLMVLIVLIFALMSEVGYVDSSAITMVLQLIVLFYAVEVTLKRMRSRVNVFTITALISLGILVGRGFLF